MRAHFLQHRLAWAAAILVGIISVLPYILPTIALGQSYKGIPFLYQDNEEIYLSRIQEVVEGHASIASPVFAEYKDVPQAQQPLGEWIYGGLIILGTHLGLSVAIILLITKALFPATLFLLIYYIVLRLLSASHSLSSRIYPALAAAFLCTLGFEMVRLSLIRDILQGTEGLYLSLWTRLVNPITGALFLLGFFHIVLSWYEKRQWRYAMLGGLILGCMTGYVFSFVYACMVLGIVSVFFLYRRTYKLWWGSVGVYALGFTVNIHYAWALLHLQSFNPGKTGMLFTYAFLMNKILLATLICLLTYTVFLYIRAGQKIVITRALGIAYMVWIASALVLNLQIFFGKTIWPQHFIQYTNVGAYISVIVIAAEALWATRARTWVLPLSLIGIGAILGLSVATVPSYITKFSDFADIQRRAVAFEWLNHNAPAACTVLAAENSARLTWAIPAYTRCDTYVSPYVFMSVTPERIEHNFLVMLRLRGATPANVAEKFTNDDLREYFFRDWRDLFAHQPDRWLASISDSQEMNAYYTQLHATMVEKYKKFYAQDFKTSLQKYGIQYVLLDTVHVSTLSPASLPFVHKVFEGDGVVLFSL